MGAEEYAAVYGRVVELVDSLDSGSSVHCGRAGSSPASPTKGSKLLKEACSLSLCTPCTMSASLFSPAPSSHSLPYENISLANFLVNPPLFRVNPPLYCALPPKFCADIYF